MPSANRVIIPYITTTARNAATPALGDMVFDTDLNDYYVGVAGTTASDPNVWRLLNDVTPAFHPNIEHLLDQLSVDEFSADSISAASIPFTALDRDRFELNFQNQVEFITDAASGITTPVVGQFYSYYATAPSATTDTPTGVIQISQVRRHSNGGFGITARPVTYDHAGTTVNTLNDLQTRRGSDDFISGSELPANGFYLGTTVHTSGFVNIATDGTVSLMNASGGGGADNIVHVANTSTIQLQDGGTDIGSALDIQPVIRQSFDALDHFVSQTVVTSIALGGSGLNVEQDPSGQAGRYRLTSTTDLDRTPVVNEYIQIHQNGDWFRVVGSPTARNVLLDRRGETLNTASTVVPRLATGIFQSASTGGCSFDPSADQNITGQWEFSNTNVPTIGGDNILTAGALSSVPVTIWSDIPSNGPIPDRTYHVYIRNLSPDSITVSTLVVDIDSVFPTTESTDPTSIAGHATHTKTVSWDEAAVNTISFDTIDERRLDVSINSIALTGILGGGRARELAQWTNSGGDIVFASSGFMTGGTARLGSTAFSNIARDFQQGNLGVTMDAAGAMAVSAAGRYDVDASLIYTNDQTGVYRPAVQARLLDASSNVVFQTGFDYVRADINLDGSGDSAGGGSSRRKVLNLTAQTYTWEIQHRQLGTGGSDLTIPANELNVIVERL